MAKQQLTGIDDNTKYVPTAKMVYQVKTASGNLISVL